MGIGAPAKIAVAAWLARPFLTGAFFAMPFFVAVGVAKQKNRVDKKTCFGWVGGFPPCVFRQGVFDRWKVFDFIMQYEP